MQKPLIEVENLTFTYESGTTALKNINLQVYKGESVAIMGENGAGKTTLCYHLNGIIPNIFSGHGKGRVTICDMNPAEHPVYELAQKVTMLLQDPDSQLVAPEVKMEVEFGPANLGFKREDIVRLSSWALKVVGLEGLEERSPEDLSGGQKQRLVLGAGLAMLPEVFVLDEPTSQLDPVGSREVLSVLRELKQKQKMTMVITTHKTEEIAELVDRVVLLHEGEIVDEGDPEDVFSKVDLLEKVGVKPPEVTLLCKRLREKLGSGVIKNIPIKADQGLDLLSNLLDKQKISFRKHEVGEIKKPERRPIIEAKNLSFVYPGQVLALQDINLTIFEGEFVGIIGQNGSGKTTLVKNFVGLLRPNEGQVIFKGEDIRKFTVGGIAPKIGLILQNPDYQLFTISAEKEIEFGLRNIKVPEERIKQIVNESLRIVGLEGKRDIYPFRLSFGDRRLLAAAAVIAMNPGVLILDEPTTAQDYRGRYLLAELAKKMQEKGHTIIMITHDMDLVAKYAERVIVLHNARVLLDGPTGYVFSKPEILIKTGVQPPQITRLAQSLIRYGIPSDIVTVKEFYKRISFGVC